MNLEILYQDEHIIAVNKPHGLLVHRTKADFNETQSVVDTLRDELKLTIYTVHRLDKPTSGVLIFALSSEVARSLSEQFAARTVQKKYLAVVRGVPPAEATIDYPLKEELDKMTDKMARKNKPAQVAVTKIRTIVQVELPFEVDKYPTTRYALVEAKPLTGRKHQIRRHLRHINNPIIGDTTHGSGKHNRFFESQFKIRRLLLACTQMTFQHPKTGVELTIKANLSHEFNQVLEKFGWKEYYDS